MDRDREDHRCDDNHHHKDEDCGHHGPHHDDHAHSQHHHHYYEPDCAESQASPQNASKTAPQNAPQTLTDQFRAVAGYIKTHKAQSACVLGSLLLGTTALATPFISGALGAGALMIGSVYALTKTTDVTLEGALATGKKWGMSALSLGLAIGAVNTIPETFVSLGAMWNGAAALGIGNIVGSNIAHNLLILGATAATAGIAATKKGLSWKFNMAVMTGGAALFGAQLIGGTLSAPVGVAMLGIGAYYLKKRLFSGKSGSQAQAADGADAAEEPGTCLFHDHGDDHGHAHGHTHAQGQGGCDHDHDHDAAHAHQPHVSHGSTLDELPGWFSAAWTLGGFAGLVGAARLLVDTGTASALHMGVNEAIIGTIAVAVGTAIPELMVNVKAAMRKESDLAIGNVVGCNIFNTLIAGGVVATMGHGVAVPEALSPASALGALNLTAFLGSTGLLAGALLAGKGSMKKWHGWAALGLYGAYMAASAGLNDGQIQNLHDHDADHNSAQAHVLQLDEMPQMPDLPVVSVPVSVSVSGAPDGAAFGSKMRDDDAVTLAFAFEQGGYKDEYGDHVPTVNDGFVNDGLSNDRSAAFIAGSDHIANIARSPHLFSSQPVDMTHVISGP